MLEGPEIWGASIHSARKLGKKRRGTKGIEEETQVKV